MYLNQRTIKVEFVILYGEFILYIILVLINSPTYKLNIGIESSQHYANSDRNAKDRLVFSFHIGNKKSNQFLALVSMGCGLVT